MHVDPVWPPEELWHNPASLLDFPCQLTPVAFSHPLLSMLKEPLRCFYTHPGELCMQNLWIQYFADRGNERKF